MSLSVRNIKEILRLINLAEMVHLLLTINIQHWIFIEWDGHGKGSYGMNENHLTFTSNGDMQAMNHKKLHHVNSK